MNTNIKATVTEAVNFRLNIEAIASLKKLARHVSYHLDDDVSYVDLIRCLIADAFPITESEDDFTLQSEKALQLCSNITKQAASAGVKFLPVTFTSSASMNWVQITPHVQSNDSSLESS